MLKIELRNLEKGDVLKDRTALPEELGIDRAPDAIRGPLELHCKVSLAGEYVLAEGWMRGTLRFTCDRCLKEFETPFRTCLEIQFKKGPGPTEDELSSESIPESDLIFFEGDSVDLGDEIRQMLELSEPMRSLCSEACRGLCGNCGADLNVEKCRCSGPPPDGRWSALKNWKP
jgi:uncharacterized protein